MSHFAAGLIAVNFILYPAFVEPGAQIETIIDKGLTLELIVGCSSQAGILTYSKAERLYCTPNFSCHGSFAAAARRLCDE